MGFPVLHYDNMHTHAFLMQIFGEKKFFVFSPEETDKMYTTKMLSPSISLSVNVANDSNWKWLAKDLCAKQPIYKALPRAMYLKSISTRHRLRL